MAQNPGISSVAALIADPSRAAMLTTLLSGQTLLASELARAARVTPQTASSHLAKLVEGGLLSTEARGRCRYFRLASTDIAHALEALSVVAKPVPVRSLRQSQEAQALRWARTCYDHLAGEIGVAVASQMLRFGWLSVDGADFSVTSAGLHQLGALGVQVAVLRGQRRVLARPCLDWSERRYHLAGALGAALTSRFFALGWIKRVNASRAVLLTDEGAQGLRNHFDLDVQRLADPPAPEQVRARRTTGGP